VLSVCNGFYNLSKNSQKLTCKDKTVLSRKCRSQNILGLWTVSCLSTLVGYKGREVVRNLTQSSNCKLHDSFILYRSHKIASLQRAVSLCNLRLFCTNKRRRKKQLLITNVSLLWLCRVFTEDELQWRYAHPCTFYRCRYCRAYMYLANLPVIIPPSYSFSSFVIEYS